MFENIETRESTARKNYRCDWCDKIIPKGEKYIRQKFVYDGEMCTWRSHRACQRVVDAIWDYADPDSEGLTSDYFMDACDDICRTFVCPDCPKWYKDDRECADGEWYCIDRMDEFFKTHELYCTREGYGNTWRCRKKEQHGQTG